MVKSPFEKVGFRGFQEVILNPPIPVVLGNKIAWRRLHYLAVKLYTIVISAISTYYTDATKSPLPLGGEGNSL
jgi:hypothetical protein